MGYLDRLNPEKHPITGGVLLGTVEYAAASFGFGYAKNRWRDKAHVFGVPVDLLTGIVAKTASIAALMTGKFEGAVPHLDALGNAGVGAYFHTLGAARGAEASGLCRVLIPASDVAKAKAALPNATILGEIPKAPPGDYLSAEDLARMARG